MSGAHSTDGDGALGGDGALRFRGRCWRVGDNIPTDQIVKSDRVFEPLEVIAHHVLEDANPAFAEGVEPGDVLVAGRHFGQSSGRAIAVKAMQATGIGCVVAQTFARTFYRNAFEIGLPVLELAEAGELVEGQTLSVDIAAGTVAVEEDGRTLNAPPPDPFLLQMLRGGGLIAIAPQLEQWT